MAKSILHDKKERTCYLCMRLNGDFTEKGVLQEHHIFFGSSRRKLSEEYGLKVYLCLQHHTAGKEAVHQNAENDRVLKKVAQEAFMKRYSPVLFMETFRKNYLDIPIEELSDSSSHEKDLPAAGIMFLGKEL